jgi:hypothetical protein
MNAASLRPLIEPVVVTDDFVQGIGFIDPLGPNARFVFYSDQTVDGEEVRVVVRKLVCPINAVPRCVWQAQQFLIQRAFGPVAKIVQLPRVR